WSGYRRNPLLAFLLSWVRDRTVRVEERTNRPHALADSLQQVADALDAGRVVVMFPEGTLTRSGHMLPFGRGVETILGRTRADVPRRGVRDPLPAEARRRLAERRGLAADGARRRTRQPRHRLSW